MTFLEEAVEDALISLVEEGMDLPESLDVYYNEHEFEAIERFHRLRYIKSKDKMGITKDRWVFISLNVLGIRVNIMPEPEPTNPETLQ